MVAPTRRWACLVVLFAVVAPIVAVTPSAAATSPAARLPPPDQQALARLFDPLVAPLGLRVSRGALEDPPTYRATPQGRHLAIYLQPAGAYVATDYARRIASAKVFLPLVFSRWRDLRSFDVCQEPPASVDPSPTPPPVTQLFVTRRGAQPIDWRHVSLVRLLAVGPSRHGSPRISATDFHFYAAPSVRGQPEYRRAAAAARHQ